jgi:hypothetical protein
LDVASSGASSGLGVSFLGEESLPLLSHATLHVLELLETSVNPLRVLLGRSTASILGVRAGPAWVAALVVIVVVVVDVLQGTLGGVAHEAFTRGVVSRVRQAHAGERLLQPPGVRPTELAAPGRR